MNKLKIRLDVDALAVESFETTRVTTERGTVHGHGDTVFDWTCNESCPDTCHQTYCACQTVDNGHTCFANTCYQMGCEGYTRGPERICVDTSVCGGSMSGYPGAQTCTVQCAGTEPT